MLRWLHHVGNRQSRHFGVIDRGGKDAATVGASPYQTMHFGLAEVFALGIWVDDGHSDLLAVRSVASRRVVPPQRARSIEVGLFLAITVGA
jgi:hypothetical protein